MKLPLPQFEHSYFSFNVAQNGRHVFRTDECTGTHEDAQPVYDALAQIPGVQISLQLKPAFGRSIDLVR